MYKFIINSKEEKINSVVFKFIEIRNSTLLNHKVKSGFMFDKVKNIIESECNAGWHLIQVIIPNKGRHSKSGLRFPLFGFFFPWSYQLIFSKDYKKQQFYEYKFSKISTFYDNDFKNKHKYKDEFCSIIKFIMSETDKEWKLKQIVYPFDEKKGLYCSLDCQLIYERQR